MEPTKRVMLQVGDRHFPTTVGTLTQCSEYFTAMFSGRWCLDKQEDGSIFVNGNPKLFEHLLEFLLRGVFPLAYDKCKGHDYLFYTQILEEVKYFDCPLLVLWLEDGCYEKCVLMNFSSHIKDSPFLLGSVSSVHLQCVTEEKVPLCPRGIWLHRDQNSSPSSSERMKVVNGEVKFSTLFCPTKIVVLMFCCWGYLVRDSSLSVGSDVSAVQIGCTEVAF
uniref:BTB domain-containing protein n=1 Tax=Coccidioides posadasii RMSCC 3488 TaxID=454284 RepID=A0A0J6F7I2_COCPO|nr:hypothetical protein CPAG_05269 [Coccidioides posadasii RMSCC 3488]